MKKLIILLLSLSAIKVNGQLLKQDHLLHATGSACIAGLTYCTVFKCTNNITWATVGSIGLTLSLGAAKELRDMKVYNSTIKQSGGDMAFNLLGTLSSVYTLRFTLNGYKKTVKPFVKL